MIQSLSIILPADYIILISQFLQDKDILNLTHSNKYYYSTQKYLTLKHTPLFTNTQTQFKLIQNYWYPNLPIPNTKHVTIQNPNKYDNLSRPIDIPATFSHITHLNATNYRIKSPFPNIQNLKLLYVTNVDFDITLPTSIENLYIEFCNTNFANESHSILNLHELHNLYYLHISDTTIDINLSNHPNLKSIDIGCSDHVSITANQPHINLTSYTSVFHNFVINPYLVPNLEYLDVESVSCDISPLTNLKHLEFDHKYGDILDLSNFTNLEDLSIKTDKVTYPINGLPKLKCMDVMNVRLINKELYPNLRRCSIHNGKEIKIDHDGISYLYIRHGRKVVLRNMRSLTKFEYEGSVIEWINNSRCCFDMLKSLDLSVNTIKRFRLNINNMKKLERLICPMNEVILAGESDNLKVARISKLESVEELRKRFRNLEDTRLGWSCAGAEGW